MFDWEGIGQVTILALLGWRYIFFLQQVVLYIDYSAHVCALDKPIPIQELYTRILLFYLLVFIFQLVILSTEAMSNLNLISYVLCRA